MSQPENAITSSNLLHAFFKLLFQNSSVVIDFLFDVFQRIPIVRSLPGIYEVLDYEAQLELKDPKGRIAVYTKRQHVRFLQDNIIAYQDRAWGDGNIFADYKCSPGVEVDRYREGHRYNILISLRESKRRGDELTFNIHRTIHNGFTRSVEDFQTDIDHRTHNLALSIVFPKSRQPSKVNLVELNTSRMTPLDIGQRYTLPDGRVRYFWHTKSARLYERYILRWEW